MSFNPDQIGQKLQGYPTKVVDSFSAYAREGDHEAFQTGVLGALGFLAETADADTLWHAPDDARLREDLNVDSLAMMEVVFLLEDLCGISIQDAEIEQVQTVGDFKRLAREKLPPQSV